MRTWQTCLALAGIAVAVVLGLAVKRAFESSARARDERRKAALSERVYALLASPREPRTDSLEPLKPGDGPLLLAIALDILRVTRGQDADRMVRLIEMAGLRRFLERGLRRGPRQLKVRILTLLAHFHDAESLALLRHYVGDPAIYVQLAALRGIADRGDLAYFQETVKILARTRDTNVPLLADTLRRFGPAAVPSIAYLARSGATKNVGLASVRALGAIGSLEAFGPLSELAGDPDPVRRAEALAALGRLGDPRALPDILWALSAPEPRVRVQAAIAAGLVGARDAVPALGASLDDAVWEVRYRAAEALYRLEAPGIAVLRASGRGEGEGAEMARDLLAEMEGLPA